MPLNQQEKFKPSIPMDKAYYIRVCNLLLLPFNRQEAYQYGVIDRDGNQIKEPSNANEQASYTDLHKLIFGLKKMILKQPGGASLLRSSSLALNSLNKIKNHRLEPKDIPRIMESFENHCKFAQEHHLRCIVEEVFIEEFVRRLEEDGEGAMPANNTSGVAGVTLPLGPVVKRKKQDGTRNSTSS